MINRNHQGSQCCMAYPQLVLRPLTRDLQAETAANEAAQLFSPPPDNQVVEVALMRQLLTKEDAG